MQKPFDVNSIMDNLDETLVQETHDAPRTSSIKTSLPRGTFASLHSEGPTPGPSNDQPTPTEDAINPSHYRSHPSGIECIEVTRHMNFNVGNAIKYLWRYLDKGDPIENLQKAQWYIDDEIRRLQGLR